MRLRVTVAAFVWLCAITGANSATQKSAYHYVAYDEETVVHLATPFVPDENRLGYAICELNIGTCDVFIETYNYDNTTSQLMCEVGVPYDDYVEVTNFVGDRIALYWVEDGNTATIHLVNVRKCKSRLIRFDIAMSPRPMNIDVILHRDTFDVFYKDPRTLLAKSYQMTFNYMGKVVKGPFRSPEMEYHGIATNIGRMESYRFPVERHSPEKGYYIYYESDEEIGSLVLFPDHKKKELVTFPQGYVHEVAVSAKNELFGMCYQHHQFTSVTCVQYNPVGTLILNITHEIPDGTSLTSMRIYNLEGGGFLMITGRCPFFGEEHCSNRFKDFYVQKFINDDDKLFKRVRVKFNDKPLELQDIAIYEDDEEFCLFAVYKSTCPLEKAYLNTNIKCFPKKLVEYMEFE